MGLVWFISVHYSVGILQVRSHHTVEDLQCLDPSFFSRARKSTIAKYK